jgi:hypothetical protein
MTTMASEAFRDAAGIAAGVVIRWRTPGVTAASVRDADGIFDVRWTSSTGWDCSCPEEFACHHVAAVRQLTVDPAGAAQEIAPELERTI